MNRTDTIKHIALSADLSRDAAGRVMDAFEVRLKAHTGAGKRVVVRGFGSFSRGLPAEKTGRNPRTGQPITYTAYRKPKSAPAVGETALRDEIAAGAQIDRAAAGRALDALQAVIVTSMKKGGAMNFYGLGRFYVRRSAAFLLTGLRTPSAVRSTRSVGSGVKCCLRRKAHGSDSEDDH